MNLLVRREHSRTELLGKLVRRDFDINACEAVLDELVEEGALSDERFVEVYVSYRRERGFGPVRIREELRQRGIDGALREQSCPPDDPEWNLRACAVRRKRFGESVPTDYHERARQARFLTQRGFNSAQMSIALDTP